MERTGSQLARLSQSTAGQELDGQSFFTLARMAGGAPEERPPIYWHFPGYVEGSQEAGTWRTTPGGAIRVGRYKLIEFFETGEIELYNVEEDIGEENNLAELERRRAEELHTMLRDWRERTGAPMPALKYDD